MDAESIRRKYKNSPIIEALCEIHFSESQTDSTVKGVFFGKVQEDYPIIEDLPRVNFNIQIPKGDVSISNQESVTRFFNNDKTELIQIASNLLTFNRLAPYEGYDNFRKSVKNVIEKYSEVAKPKAFERIGLRYINHIFIPETILDLDEYFSYMPKIEEVLYQIRLNIELKSVYENHNSYLTISSIPSAIENYGAILLDIYDVYSAKNEFELESILNKIDETHFSVEQIFEKVITEKTRLLFEEVKND